jgi:Rad3-related DNA helicase
MSEIRKKINSILFNTMHLDMPLRDVQIQTLKIDDDRDRNKKFSIYQCPTGSGKSYIFLNMIKSRLKENKNVKIDLLTSTKLLQQQYVDDYAYIENLWGKNNYQCKDHNTTCDKGQLINRSKKKEGYLVKCEYCPYELRKSLWLDGNISLTNFHTIAYYALYNNEFLKGVRKANILMIDECHLIEPLFSSLISFQLTAKNFKKIFSEVDIEEVENKIGSLEDINSVKKMLEKYLIPKLEHYKFINKNDIDKPSKHKEAVKIVSDLDDIINKCKSFIKHTDLDNWIFDKKMIKNDIIVDVKPLWIGETIKKALFDVYDEVIMMSATIGEINTFVKLNGIDINEVNHAELPSTFPLENRPVYYWNCGKMNFAKKQETWKVMKDVIKKLLKKYKGKKGIIHTNSFELTSWIERDINDDRLIIAKIGAGMDVLNEHFNRTDDSVIVSPSMAEGVNLNEDAARFSIIVKMPYPDLSDKVVKKRLELFPDWYMYVTCNKIVQTVGRGVRSEKDKCDTIILDGCFSDVIRNGMHMFPQYFIDSIQNIN